MPTNTQVLNALQFSGPVPPDQECNIGTLTQILQGAVNFLTLATQTALLPGGSATGDSIAQQALQVANTALAAATAATQAIPATRSDVAIALPTGDSTIALSWTNPMPDDQYVVIGTYIGGTPNVGTYFNFRIIDGTQTINGVSLRFENTPAGYKFQYCVQQVKTTST